MAKLILDVPLVAQRKQNTCWYAAVCMVCYYREAGPRLGIPEKWENNEPIYPREFVTLAKAEGLRGLSPGKNSITAGDLHWLIRSHGPLWSAGYWFGVGHVVVVTGIDGRTVHFNDPDSGVKKNNTIDWFNKKLAKPVNDCLMYKPVAR